MDIRLIQKEFFTQIWRKMQSVQGSRERRKESSDNGEGQKRKKVAIMLQNRVRNEYSEWQNRWQKPKKLCLESDVVEIICMRFW